jgi:hypothetical protein
VKVEDKNMTPPKHINGKVPEPLKQNTPLSCTAQLRMVVDVVDSPEPEVQVPVFSARAEVREFHQ